jgi:hypothetical protein
MMKPENLKCILINKAEIAINMWVAHSVSFHSLYHTQYVRSVLVHWTRGYGEDSTKHGTRGHYEDSTELADTMKTAPNTEY